MNARTDESAMSFSSLRIRCKCKSKSEWWRIVTRAKNWIWTKELKIIRSISSFHMHAFEFLLWRLSIRMAHKIIFRLENVEKSEDQETWINFYLENARTHTGRSSTFIIKSTDTRMTHEHQNFIPLGSPRCVYSSKLICVKFNYATPLFDAQLASLFHSAFSYHNFFHANIKSTIIKFRISLRRIGGAKMARANISVHYSYRETDARHCDTSAERHRAISYWIGNWKSFWFDIFGARRSAIGIRFVSIIIIFFVWLAHLSKRNEWKSVSVIY